MDSIYPLFKFLHVAAVIFWIGGVATLSMLNLRLAREQDRTASALLLRHSRFFGRAVIGPAAVITLVAGIVTATSVGINFGALWITWGFVGIFVSLVLGATLIRAATGKLGELVRTAAPGDVRLSAAQQRLTILNIANLVLLLSVVWAMIFKPTL